MEKAREPANILWENIVPSSEVPFILLRRVITIGISIIILLISFAAILKVR